MRKKNGFVMTEILVISGMAVMLATSSLYLLTQGLIAYNNHQLLLKANELVQTEDDEELDLQGFSIREKVVYDVGTTKAVYLIEVYDAKTEKVLANKISCR